MERNQRPAFFYGYIIVFACFLIQGVGIGTYAAFGVFFKPLLSEFEWSRATVSGASALAYLSMGLVGILVGNLNDRFGPRIIMMVSGAIYGAGYLLLSQVHSIWQLYVFYSLILGIGLGSVDVMAMTLTARWFVRRRGTMTGLVKVGTGAGQMIMPLVAGLFILNYGWRHAAVLLAAIATVFLLAAGLLLRRDPAQMGLLPDGIRVPVHDGPQKKESRLTLGEATRTPQFWLLCWISLMVVGCLMTTFVHIVPHAGDVGLDPMEAAGVMSVIGGMSMAGRFLSGVAVDRIGNRISMTLCFSLLILDFLWLQAAGEAWMLYLFAIFYGLAHGAYFTLVSPMVAELFGTLSHGVLVGIIFFTGNVGGSIGPVAAGYVFDSVRSYRPVFWVLIGIAALALLLVAFLKPVARKA